MVVERRECFFECRNHRTILRTICRSLARQDPVERQKSHFHAFDRDRFRARVFDREAIESRDREHDVEPIRERTTETWWHHSETGDPETTRCLGCFDDPRIARALEPEVD